jgi:hypothetical protein
VACMSTACPAAFESASQQLFCKLQEITAFRCMLPSTAAAASGRHDLAATAITNIASISILYSVVVTMSRKKTRKAVLQHAMWELLRGDELKMCLLSPAHRRCPCLHHPCRHRCPHSLLRHCHRHHLSCPSRLHPSRHRTWCLHPPPPIPRMPCQPGWSLCRSFKKHQTFYLF